jgi:hypothetical protein
MTLFNMPPSQWNHSTLIRPLLHLIEHGGTHVHANLNLFKKFEHPCMHGLSLYRPAPVIFDALSSNSQRRVASIHHILSPADTSTFQYLYPYCNSLISYTTITHYFTYLCMPFLYIYAVKNCFHMTSISKWAHQHNICAFLCHGSPNCRPPGFTK